MNFYHSCGALHLAYTTFFVAVYKSMSVIFSEVYNEVYRTFYRFRFVYKLVKFNMKVVYNLLTTTNLRCIQYDIQKWVIFKTE